MTTSSTFPLSSARSLVLGRAAVLWTGRREGDLTMAPDYAVAERALTRLAGRPVSWLRQVHGAGVTVVSPAYPARDRGEEGDALVTSGTTALAVMTADCAPIALTSPEGIIAAVHAGWRGLVGGVVQAAVAAMRDEGAGQVDAALGPCIHSECYAFGGAELGRVAARLGDGVRAERADGQPALNLPAAVGAALHEAGATLVHDVDECTACLGDRYYSHRARNEPQRQAMVVWKR